MLFQVRFNVNVNGEVNTDHVDNRRKGKMMRQKEIAMSFDLSTNQPRHFEKVGMDLKTFDEITRSDYNMNKETGTKVTIGGLTCTFHPTPVGNILLTRSGTRVNKKKLESGVKCLPPELQNPTRTPSPNANRKFKREISYLDSLDHRDDHSTSAGSRENRLPSVSETVSVESDVTPSCYTMCKGPRVKTNRFLQQRAQKSRYYTQTVKLIRFAKNTISHYHK